jgi:hypothetical protein
MKEKSPQSATADWRPQIRRLSQNDLPYRREKKKSAKPQSRKELGNIPLRLCAKKMNPSASVGRPPREVEV